MPGQTSPCTGMALSSESCVATARTWKRTGAPEQRTTIDIRKVPFNLVLEYIGGGASQAAADVAYPPQPAAGDTKGARKSREQAKETKPVSKWET